MNQTEQLMAAVDAYADQYKRDGATPLTVTHRKNVRATIEAALKPREPVAYRYWDVEGGWRYGEACCAEKDDELLYTAAPQPQQEPVAYGLWDTQLGRTARLMMVRLDKGQDGCTVPLFTYPPDDTALLRQALDALEMAQKDAQIAEASAAIAALKERLNEQ
jgi:hypothetical protein